MSGVATSGTRTMSRKTPFANAKMFQKAPEAMSVTKMAGPMSDDGLKPPPIRMLMSALHRLDAGAARHREAPIGAAVGAIERSTGSCTRCDELHRRAEAGPTTPLPSLREAPGVANASSSTATRSLRAIDISSVAFFVGRAKSGSNLLGDLAVSWRYYPLTYIYGITTHYYDAGCISVSFVYQFECECDAIMYRAVRSYMGNTNMHIHGGGGANGI